MNDKDIYPDLVQPRGRAYSDKTINQKKSHYPEPIDQTPGRGAGNSRIWGDATPQVQSAAIDSLIASAERAGLSAHDTAYVLAIARKESGFNPDAAAGSSSAYGLGQSLDGTGGAYGLTLANRDDLTMQSDVLVAMYVDNAHLATARGQGEEYIYKYHHDGPHLDSGGLAISLEGVMPYVDAYESFVLEHQKTHGISPPGPSLVTRKASTLDHREHEATLHAGMHNAAVETLQEKLNQLGYVDSRGNSLVVDGQFGRGTLAAVKAFQEDHRLTVDGKVGPRTLEALEHERASRISAVRRLDDPQHPDAQLYSQARAAVFELDSRNGRVPDQFSNNLAAALTVSARREGLTCINGLLLSDDASKVFAVQNHRGDFVDRFASVPTLEGLNTPMQRSSTQWLQVREQAQPMALPPQQHVPEQVVPAHRPAGPVM